jgi:hypothetical protein
LTYIVGGSLDLVSGLVNTLSFLLEMKTKVLQKDHGAGLGVSASGLNLLADAVAQEKNFSEKVMENFEIKLEQSKYVQLH